jgi:hypothetical protein
VGTVITGTEVPQTSEQRPFGGVPATVRVETIVRGLDAKIKEVQVSPAIGSSCYFAMRAGERWLVFGGYDEKRGMVGTGLCSGSRQILPGDAIVERMTRSFVAGPNLFFGNVRRYKGWDSRWRDDNLLPGVEVRLYRPQKDWTAKTDKRGYFEVDGLPAGEYNFEVRSQGLSAEEPEDSLGNSGSGVPSKIHIQETGCVEAPVMMWPDQGITGVLRGPSGTPVVGVAVAAYRLDDRGQARKVREAKSSADGHYVLPRLEDGTYMAGVNGAVEFDNEPYRMTFYPAAHSRRDAVRITIRGNTVSGIDIVLDAPRTPVKVTVRAVSADGKPAPVTWVEVVREDKGRIWLTPVNRTGPVLPYGLYTDKSGQLMVELFEGDAYIFSAEWLAPMPAGQPSRRQTARKVRTVATRDSPVVLRLSP